MTTSYPTPPYAMEPEQPEVPAEPTEPTPTEPTATEQREERRCFHPGCSTLVSRPVTSLGMPLGPFVHDALPASPHDPS